MCTSPIVLPGRVTVKCRQCIECRLSYSREWAIRMTHEMQSHERCSMVTLTYDQDHLPRFGQLHKDHLQRFFKRLRKISPKFKYVASGEYGDQSRRPHFHICFFGIDFGSDRIEFGKAVNGDLLFVSALLASVWPFGRHSIGSLNFESAAYVSRYILKKVSGPGASPLPLACDPDTGELVFPNPEFMVCSKGIGRSWFRDFFMTDVFPHASVVTAQGTKAPVPRFYKSLLKEVGHDLAMQMSFIASKRQDSQIDRTISDNTPQRRFSRSKIMQSKTSIFSRNVNINK